MKLIIHAACDVGLLRTNNEDMLLVEDVYIRDRAYHGAIETGERPRWFFAAADGLGGEAAGEAASSAALEEFRRGVETLSPGLEARDLRAFFATLTERTHRRLTEEGERDPAERGMGTTLTGLLLYFGSWYWVHIGDTRLYRYADGALVRITRDHTMRELLNRPDIPSNYLANFLGGGVEEVYCDFGEAPGPDGEGDAFLLSSDGLHDLLGDPEIEAIIRRLPEDPTKGLVDAAKSVGGRDNISCLFIVRG
jgi:protein phosphatase